MEEHHKESFGAEYALLKVPYELLWTCLRNEPRLFEREMQSVQTVGKKLVRTLRSGKKPNRKRMQKALLDIVKQIDGLTKKISDAYERESHHLLRCERRIELLRVVDSSDVRSAIRRRDSEALTRWAVQRIDRQVANFLFRQNQVALAQSLSTLRELDDYVDAKVFLDGEKVVRSLRNRNVAVPLGWCSVNRSRLRKSNSPLEFLLRLQDFLELSRCGKTEEAVAYARKHLVAFSSQHMSVIQRAIASLAFCRTGSTHCVGSSHLPPSNSCDPYEDLYHQRRWDELEETFLQALNDVTCFPKVPMLYTCMGGGLVSMRTRQCDDGDTRQADCSVCFPTVSKLAQILPYAHHTNSTIVCHITGEAIDDYNYPMVLPNGRVYGKNAMEKMAKENNNQIKCPRTGETFMVSQLRKAHLIT